MFAQLRKAQPRNFLLALGFVLLGSVSAFAQTTTMEGDVKGPDGQPLKGALITLDRTDIKGHYQVKSDKKGHWFYMGLPEGTYNINCVVDGKVMDKVNGVKSKFSDNVRTDFDLSKGVAQQQALQQAAQTGQVSAETEKGMTKEQKEQFEAQAKKASETMKKNKALNDAFNAGMDNLKKGQADTDPAQKQTDLKAAVDGFNKANEMDATQLAIVENLGMAQYDLGMAQSGDDKTKTLDESLATYQKASTMKPDEAGIYLQIGNIYAAEKKMPEAETALNKAVQLDPSLGPKVYFNLGANLVNSGHPEQATDWFKKATDANPQNAEAWYQLGSTLALKGTVDPKTGAQAYPPGTSEAYHKYLELQPNGPHAQEAQAMLTALGETVQTKVSVPTAKSGKKK